MKARGFGRDPEERDEENGPWTFSKLSISRSITWADSGEHQAPHVLLDASQDSRKCSRYQNSLAYVDGGVRAQDIDDGLVGVRGEA